MIQTLDYQKRILTFVAQLELIRDILNRKTIVDLVQVVPLREEITRITY